MSRALEYIFAKIENSDISYLITVSFFEIYNDRVFDLLAD